MSGIKLAVVGATGMVGRTFLKVLEERDFIHDEIFFFASKRSAGSTITYKQKEYIVEELTETSFDRGIDIALFSAGTAASLKYAPIAASHGCVVIDNSSAWRMDDDVPLVVPEVNPLDIEKHKNIIANPNCSTIQAVVALNPIHKKYGIKRIVYSTYQAVSGAGLAGYNDLKNGINGVAPVKFPKPIAFNVIPHIDVFLENGYTKEEMKMVNETRKILGDRTIKITSTAVRVPVYNGHSESINVETLKPFDIDSVRSLLAGSPGIIVMDDTVSGIYPTPLDADGRDETFVGRIRRDESIENGLNMWVVADNIRKGAATNAVQIAILVADKLNKEGK
jgi:aspartate-semialdehyde dehydrogenase